MNKQTATVVKVVAACHLVMEAVTVGRNWTRYQQQPTGPNLLRLLLAGGVLLADLG